MVARALKKAAKVTAKESTALAQGKVGAEQSSKVTRQAARGTAAEVHAATKVTTADGAKQAYKRGRRQEELPEASLPPPPPPKRARVPLASPPQLLLPAPSPMQTEQGEMIPAPVSHRCPSDTDSYLQEYLYIDEDGNYIYEVVL